MDEVRGKGRILLNEAAQFAIAFDRIGRELLTQLDGIPQQALSWPVPLPGSNSLMSYIAHLIEESRFWIMTVVGGQALENTRPLEKLYTRKNTVPAPHINAWLTTLHEVLDTIPDATMNLIVVLPIDYRPVFGAGITTVRDCLLYTLGQSAREAGYVQLLCSLFADGERLLRSVTE